MGSVQNVVKFIAQAFNYVASDGESVASSNLHALSLFGGVSNISIDGDGNLLFTNNRVDYTVPDGYFVTNSDEVSPSPVMDPGQFASQLCFPVSSPATATVTATVTLS